MKREPEIRACVLCGTEFETINGHFCSVACMKKLSNARTLAKKKGKCISWEEAIDIINAREGLDDKIEDITEEIQKDIEEIKKLVERKPKKRLAFIHVSSAAGYYG